LETHKHQLPCKDRGSEQGNSFYKHDGNRKWEGKTGKGSSRSNRERNKQETAKTLRQKNVVLTKDIVRQPTKSNSRTWELHTTWGRVEILRKRPAQV